MPGHWWQSLRTHFEPAPVADPLWRRALMACPLARRLDPERQQRLRKLASLFLARKQFHALAGAVLDDYWRLLIAMQACLPALQQGAASLRGWREVLIYPGEFKVRRSHHDDHTGVVTEGDEMRIGEAWEHGPLVLSLADVQLDLEQPWDGYNVVVHEMAHKLDMLDGPPDGVPPLVEIPRRRWIMQFQQAYDRLASMPADSRDSPASARRGSMARWYCRWPTCNWTWSSLGTATTWSCTRWHTSWTCSTARPMACRRWWRFRGGAGSCSSSRPTTAWPACRRTAATARSTITPPKAPANILRWSANCTTRSPTCCARRNRRSPNCSKRSTAARRPMPASRPPTAVRAEPGTSARRQIHAEARTTQFRRTVDHQFPAIGMHDVLHDRQADTVALHPLVAAHAALQHLLDLVRGDARAIVFHAQPQSGSLLPAGIGLHLHHQQHAVACPLERVLQQVAHQLQQVALLAVEHRALLDVEFAQHILGGVDLFQTLHQIFRVAGDRHCAGKGLPAGRGGARQLVGNQFVHPPHLVEHAAPLLRVVASRRLQLGADHCQRRLQAVRQVGQGVPVARALLALVGDERVDALGQAGEFQRVLAVQLFAVAALDPAHVAGHLAQRGQAPAQQQQLQHDQHHAEDRQPDHQGVAEHRVLAFQLIFGLRYQHG